MTYLGWKRQAVDEREEDQSEAGDQQAESNCESESRPQSPSTNRAVDESISNHAVPQQNANMEEHSASAGASGGESVTSDLEHMQTSDSPEVELPAENIRNTSSGSESVDSGVNSVTPPDHRTTSGSHSNSNNTSPDTNPSTVSNMNWNQPTGSSAVPAFPYDTGSGQDWQLPSGSGTNPASGATADFPASSSSRQASDVNWNQPSGSGTNQGSGAVAGCSSSSCSSRISVVKWNQPSGSGVNSASSAFPNGSRSNRATGAISKMLAKAGKNAASSSGRCHSSGGRASSFSSFNAGGASGSGQGASGSGAGDGFAGNQQGEPFDNEDQPDDRDPRRPNNHGTPLSERPSSNGPCRVCGQPAAGLHYGAFTCEGCKSFFGRTYRNPEVLGKCRRYNRGSGLCNVSGNNRTVCKPCRYSKCLLAKMSRTNCQFGRRSTSFNERMCALANETPEGARTPENVPEAAAQWQQAEVLNSRNEALPREQAVAAREEPVNSDQPPPEAPRIRGHLVLRPTGPSPQPGPSGLNQRAASVHTMMPVPHTQGSSHTVNNGQHAQVSSALSIPRIRSCSASASSGSHASRELQPLAGPSQQRPAADARAPALSFPYFADRTSSLLGYVLNRERVLINRLRDPRYMYALQESHGSRQQPMTMGQPMLQNREQLLEELLDLRRNIAPVVNPYPPVRAPPAIELEAAALARRLLDEAPVINHNVPMLMPPPQIPSRAEYPLAPPNSRAYPSSDHLPQLAAADSYAQPAIINGYANAAYGPAPLLPMNAQRLPVPFSDSVPARGQLAEPMVLDLSSARPGGPRIEQAEPNLQLAPAPNYLSTHGEEEAEDDPHPQDEPMDLSRNNN